MKSIQKRKVDASIRLPFQKHVGIFPIFHERQKIKIAQKKKTFHCFKIKEKLRNNFSLNRKHCYVFYFFIPIISPYFYAFILNSLRKVQGLILRKFLNFDKTTHNTLNSIHERVQFIKLSLFEAEKKSSKFRLKLLLRP